MNPPGSEKLRGAPSADRDGAETKMPAVARKGGDRPDPSERRTRTEPTRIARENIENVIAAVDGSEAQASSEAASNTEASALDRSEKRMGMTSERSECESNTTTGAGFEKLAAGTKSTLGRVTALDSFEQRLREKEARFNQGSDEGFEQRLREKEARFSQGSNDMAAANVKREASETGGGTNVTSMKTTSSVERNEPGCNIISNRRTPALDSFEQRLREKEARFNQGSNDGFDQRLREKEARFSQGSNDIAAANVEREAPETGGGTNVTSMKTTSSVERNEPGCNIISNRRTLALDSFEQRLREKEARFNQGSNDGFEQRLREKEARFSQGSNDMATANVEREAPETGNGTDVTRMKTTSSVEGNKLGGTNSTNGRVPALDSFEQRLRGKEARFSQGSNDDAKTDVEREVSSMSDGTVTNMSTTSSVERNKPGGTNSSTGRVLALDSFEQRLRMKETRFSQGSDYAATTDVERKVSSMSDGTVMNMSTTSSVEKNNSGSPNSSTRRVPALDSFEQRLRTKETRFSQGSDYDATTVVERKVSSNTPGSLEQNEPASSKGAKNTEGAQLDQFEQRMTVSARFSQEGSDAPSRGEGEVLTAICSASTNGTQLEEYERQGMIKSVHFSADVAADEELGAHMSGESVDSIDKASKPVDSGQYSGGTSIQPDPISEEGMESGMPILEATLVRERSVYAAFAMTDEPPKPWWKRRGTWVSGAIIATLGVTLGAVLGTRDDGDNDPTPPPTPQLCSPRIADDTFRIRFHARASGKGTLSGVEIYFVDGSNNATDGHEALMEYDHVNYTGAFGNWTSPGYVTCESSTPLLGIMVCPTGADRLEVNRLELLAWNGSAWNITRHWAKPYRNRYWGIPSIDPDLPDCILFDGDGGNSGSDFTSGITSRANSPSESSATPYCRYSPGVHCLNETNQGNASAKMVLSPSSLLGRKENFRLRLEARSPDSWNTRTGVEFFLVENDKFGANRTYEANMVFERLEYETDTDPSLELSSLSKSHFWESPANFTCSFPADLPLFEYSVVVCPLGTDNLLLDRAEILEWIGNDQNGQWRSFRRWEPPTNQWSIPLSNPNYAECLRFYGDGDVSRGGRPLRRSCTSYCTGGAAEDGDDEADGGLEVPTETDSSVQATIKPHQTFRVRLHGGANASESSTQTGVDMYLVVNDDFVSAGTYEAKMISDSVIYGDTNGSWTTPENFTCYFPENQLHFSFGIIMCPFGMDTLTVTRAEILEWQEKSSEWESLGWWGWDLQDPADYWNLPSRYAGVSDCVRFGAGNVSFGIGGGVRSRPQRPLRRSEAPICRHYSVSDRCPY